MVNKKTVSLRLKPYLQEVKVQIVLDILIVAMILIILTLANFPLIATILCALVYFTIALFFHYKVAIQAMIDIRKGDYITEIVCIKRFTNEYSFSGNRFGHSYISFFYPKEMRVSKYKVKVIDTLGSEKKLRSVMSFRRLLEFAVLDKQQIEFLQITYLKRSKIIICICLSEKVDKNINNKKMQTINKSIHFINNSI